MGIASWARFIIGLLLSIEIIRLFLTETKISEIAIILAAVFIGLSAWFIVGKLIFKL